MLEIVVTGGSGFLGTHLLNHPFFSDALAIGRSSTKGHAKFEKVSFSDEAKLFQLLDSKDIVIHLAGRAHVLNDTSPNKLNEYREINTTGVLNVAEQAARAGVKRFIFISTVKVLGEHSYLGHPFRYDSTPNPQDAYGTSKLEAEKGLAKIGINSSMEIVIIRPPLIYGNGVKGNFANLMKLCQLSLPLPFGKINNIRSLVGVENLIDLIIVCSTHPNAKGRTFLVSDDQEISSSELLKKLSEAGGYKCCIFNFPAKLLQYFFRFTFMQSTYHKLFGTLQVDIEFTKSVLNWVPPYDMKTSLEKCWKKIE